MRLKRKLTVWSSALALSCAALSVGVAQAQAQQAQAPASAKQEEPERYGPFFFLRSEPDLLIYVGAVGANDMLNLKKALREHPTISTIVLQNNGGGLVHIGLVVAEEIYERGLNTYIPKDSYCASACSFVFFAGRQRGGGPAGRAPDLGAGADGRAGAVRRVGHRGDPAEVRRVGGCAGHHVQHAVQDMYFFTPQEIAKYGINRVGPTQASASGAQQGGASAPRLPRRPRRSSRHPRPPRRRSSRRPRRPARRNCPAPAAAGRRRSPIRT